jgi:hypothetical protein
MRCVRRFLNQLLGLSGSVDRGQNAARSAQAQRRSAKHSADQPRPNTGL